MKSPGRLEAALLLTIIIPIASVFVHCSPKDPVEPDPGIQWRRQTLPGSALLVGITGSSKSNLLAAASSSTLFHFNGADWKSITLNGCCPSALWMDGDGYAFVTGTRELIAEFRPALCDTIRSVSCWDVTYCYPCYDEYAFYGVWGLSRRQVYAVGYYDLYDSSYKGSEIRFYNGSDWIDINPGTDELLYAVWGSAVDNVYAVGAHMLILRWDGTKWDPIDHGLGSDTALYGIWGENWRSIYVVGQNGTIVRFDGNQWVRQTSNVTVDLRGIWGSRSDNVFTVGDKGTILRYDGQTWTRSISGTNVDLRGVWGVSDTDVYVAGDACTVLLLK